MSHHHYAQTIKLTNLRGQIVDLDVHDCTRFDDGATPCAFCRLNAQIGSLAGLYVVPYDIPGFYDVDPSGGTCDDCDDDADLPVHLFRLWLEADDAKRTRGEQIYEQWYDAAVAPVLHPGKPFP